MRFFNSEDLPSNFARFLGAWYSIFPFKLSELTYGLPLEYQMNETQKVKMLSTAVTGLLPNSRLTNKEKSDLLKTLDDDNIEELKAYKEESKAIESSLSFLSSSSQKQTGGFCDYDLSFRGTLRRYFRETLADDLLCFDRCQKQNIFGVSPAGQALGIISTHRKMRGLIEKRSYDNIPPTHGVRSYLNSNDLWILHRYLKQEIFKKRADCNTTINGLLTELENLRHKPIDHIDGFSNNLQLLDFQRETVGWAYERETMPGGIQELLWTKLPFAGGFVSATEAVPVDVYFSPVFNTFKTKKPSVIRGGFITEQMVSLLLFCIIL